MHTHTSVLSFLPAGGTRRSIVGDSAQSAGRFSAKTHELDGHLSLLGTLVIHPYEKEDAFAYTTPQLPLAQVQEPPGLSGTMQEPPQPGQRVL